VMTINSENPMPTMAASSDPRAESEALYDQGMAHYRAHEWAAARACFLRVLELDARRHGVAQLLDEVEYFLRLEGASAADRPAAQPTRPSQPVRRVAILTLVGVVLLAIPVALAMTPTPRPAETSLIRGGVFPIARIMGPARVQWAGTNIWREWRSDDTLHSGDRLRSDDTTVEVYLTEGTVLTLAPGTILEVGLCLDEDGQCRLRQTSGSMTVVGRASGLVLETASSRILPKITPVAFRTTIEDRQRTTISVEAGEVFIEQGGTYLLVTAGREALVQPDQPAALAPEPTTTATATRTGQPVGPASPTATTTLRPSTALPTPTETPKEPSATPTYVPTATATISPSPTPTRTSPPPPTPLPPTPTPRPPTPTAAPR